MHNFVKQLKNRQAFNEAIEAKRLEEQTDYKLRNSKKNVAVFNSKLFTAQTGVVITGASRYMLIW